MTNKEALDSILSYFDFDYYKHKNIYNCTKIIKQDLERLEVLEKENKELEEYNYMLECRKFYKENQENEKLKKAIEKELELLIERKFNAYSCDNYEVYNVIDAIIEELKEVLDE